MTRHMRRITTCKDMLPHALGLGFYALFHLLCHILRLLVLIAPSRLNVDYGCFIGLKLNWQPYINVFELDEVP